MLNRTLAVVILAGLALPALAADVVSPVERQFVARPGNTEFSGQLIVRPARNLHPSQDQEARAALAGMIAKYYPEVDEYVIDVPNAQRSGKAGVPSADQSGNLENALSAKLMATGLFQYAVPNWICYPNNTPNDPLLGSQWHHAKMQSTLGWDISTGITNIITAYTDTGIDLTHPDLAAKRVFGFDAPNDIAEADGGSVAELHGHGTHVAGCGAAITNNGVGVAGVNWNARIMMIRVTNNAGGGASYDDLIQGARWAADNGAKTVSASYSGVNNPSLETTGAYIKSVGSLYFYAAGNDGANLNFDHPNVIVVGASDPNDNRAGFSAYGQAIDVFAPGTGILSSTWGGGYEAWDGTSMATPLANGVASLIWSINPNLTPTQVETLLFSSCDDMGTPGNDNTYGWGRVNVFKAAQQAAGTVGPMPPDAVNDSAGNAVEDSPVTVDVLANDYDLNGDPIVITTFQTTSAHGGTITRSVGTGPGGRDQLIYLAPDNYTGPDTFNYTISDNVDGTDTATVTANVLGSDFFRDPENPTGAEPALEVDWYSFTSNKTAIPDMDAMTPYLSTTVVQLNQNQTLFQFMNSTRSDRLSGRFEGYIEVPTTDIYDFTLESDEGSRMYIGNTLVVDHDGVHTFTQETGSIGLKAGKHAVRVEYFENTSHAGLRMYYASSTLAKTIIPANAYWHGGSLGCPADFDGSGFVDIEDYSAFVLAFEAGDESADFDESGFVDTDDFDAFVEAFENGC
ncbi:MAG: S8 family serine peptidase [Phycisphaerales bacterium]|nr:S8 family serine peptidase [Phycisphaerales bacterium]